MDIASTASLDATTLDQGYDLFLGHLEARFAATLAAHGPCLFTTDAEGLFAAYLDAMPGDRQHYACRCCERFLGVYGGLVAIDAGGKVHPAFWDGEGAPEFFKPSIEAMARVVAGSKVTGVFLSKDATWGLPVSGKHKTSGVPWTHAAVGVPEGLLYRGLLLSPGQAMAGKKEDRNTVCRALAEFGRASVEQALTILEGEALYRSEKVIGPARWLWDLHVARDVVRPHLRDNVVWRAVATAPDGFCHPRSSMIGTLLEDIAAGMDFETVSRRFASKMHPLRYQRPQAAPSAGNIAEAEKMVEKLGVKASLARRFARLEEVEAIWKPRPKADAAPADGGVFGHLKAKGDASSPSPLVTPPITITWEKFARTVLPEAESIAYLVPSGSKPYAALVTAADVEAPPILQWDRPSRRNPVSWYVYNMGSPALQWGLHPGSSVAVDAIAFNPAHWGAAGQDPPAHPHHGQGVIFILEGCKDNLGDICGGALFPETLKSELHGIRPTIEAYSRNATLAGLESATACGLLLGKGNDTWDATFRVIRKGGAVQDYRLDRWD